MKKVKVELTEKSYIFAGQEMIFYIEKLFAELMDGEE